MSGVTPLFDAIWDDYMFWSILVGAFSFGWLYHHTYYYRAKEGESPNIDNLEVGVFPKEYDNFKLEVTWTVLPLSLIHI